MNKNKLTWQIIIGALVLYGVGMGISRHMHMNRLAHDLRDGTQQEKIAAARELMRHDRLYDKVQEMPKSKRIAAVNVIQEIPGELTVRQCRVLLRDTEATVRARITEALTVLGKDHIQVLVPAIKDSDENVRNGAKAALVGIGPKVIPYVQPAVKEADLRAAACDVLVRVGAPSVPALVELLADDDQDVRMAAADALGKIGSKDATLALLESTRDVAAVRRVAISSLCAIRDPRSAELLIDVLGHTRDDGSVRARAGTALSVIGGGRAISALVAALGDLDLKVRTSVITGLQRIGNPAVKPVLGAISGGSKEVRRAGAAVLEKIGSPSAAAALPKLTRDSDPAIRLSAARGLGEQRPSAQVRVLIGMLADEDGGVADAAADSLVNLGSPAVPTLLSTISTPGRSEVVKFRAAGALARIGSAAVPELLRIANAGGTASAWAAYALGRAGDPVAKPILRKLAKSTDRDVRWTAMRALERL